MKKRKEKKEKEKNEMEKKTRKKEKRKMRRRRGRREGTSRDGSQNVFLTRNGTRNREAAIQAKKKNRFSTPDKRQKLKKKWKMN